MNGPQIRFQGNVVRKPDIRYTTDEGKPYARISVAVNTYRGPDRDRNVDYFDVMLYGERAERIAPSAEKGRWVYVEGVFHRDDYTNEAEGTKYTTLRVQGREFVFLEPGQTPESSESADPPQDEEDEDQTANEEQDEDF